MTSPKIRPCAVDADVLALAYESSPDWISVLDRAGKILSMSEGRGSVAEPTDAPEHLGQTWSNLWDGEEHLCAKSAVEAAARGERAQFHGFLGTLQGTPRWWDSTILPLRGADGKIGRLLAISRDVSDSIELRQELSRAQLRVEALISAVAEIVWHAVADQGSGSSRGFSGFSGTGTEVENRQEWLSLVHAADRVEVERHSAAALSAGISYVSHYRLRHHSGTYRWVEDRAVPIRAEGGELAEWVGVITDIHDRVVAEEALREGEERLRLATSASQVGIWDVDLLTGTRRWSSDLKSLLGLPFDAVESEALLLDMIDPQDRAAVAEANRTAFRDAPRLAFRVRRADTGEQRWILSTGRAILDQTGRPVRRLGTFQDITDRKRSEEQLWRAANHDPLTGTANRSAFNAKLETLASVAGSPGVRAALLVIDIDHFKLVNDTIGHDAGDFVLRQTAERLRSSCGESATIARFGGDEFAVLLTKPGSMEDVARLAGQVVTNLAAPIKQGQTEIICPSSLGVAVFPDHDRDFGEMLKNADLALYASKRNGRARYSLFDPAMKAAMRNRAAVLHRAREALLKGDIEPYYQPKVSADNGGLLDGFEALLRWRCDGTLKSPAELAEALEDPDLSVQIGERMLELVTSDMSRWRSAGHRFGSVALNVSASEFARGDIAKRWLSALERADLPSTSLQIEVTESVFLGEKSGEVGKALNVLHGLGIKVALDDFGTGYASLTHLRQYPVDLLKIDKSFIDDLEEDSGSHAIVSAVIDLAHRLGIRVVAEGVETSGQRTILASRNCDLIQGYLVAKPMAASRVPQFLQALAGGDPEVAAEKLAAGG